MSQDNSTVRFVEDKGKWMWKRYDANGSVIGRSALFDTEREARDDYQAKDGQLPAEPVNAPVEPEKAPEAPVNDDPAARGAIDEGQAPAENAPVAPEESAKAEDEGTATTDETASSEHSEDNTAGTAENAPVEGSVNL